MIVQAQEFKAAGRTETGTPDDGARIPEAPGSPTDLGDQGLD
jgi:hypothetical protein